MPRNPPIDKMLAPDGKTGPKMVSDKLGEPMALFAVPLPSACKSDFLCLCKRLFWNVGTSYFSAFCPLTAEETRVLPHSSSVVQLVSVTPAVVTEDARAKGISQDLLAYTLWGDIVGIPYVSISRDRHLKGKMTKAFPFDDLTSSAWVPAINAPFVGATAGNGLGNGGPMKDVFIIRNDAKTRQSLLTGENVVFSQQDGQSSATAPDKEPLTSPTPSIHPVSVGVDEIPPSEDESKKDQSSKMSPTSSSLYKSYNANKKSQEKGAVSIPLADGPREVNQSSEPVSSENCDGFPSMMLPRIESVFSLAGSNSSQQGGLSKQLVDTLAQKSALPLHELPPSQSPGVSKIDASVQQADIPRDSDVIPSSSETTSVRLSNEINAPALQDSQLAESSQKMLASAASAPRPVSSPSSEPLQDCSSASQMKPTEGQTLSLDFDDDCPNAADVADITDAVVFLSSLGLPANTATAPVHQDNRRKRCGITVKELLEGRSGESVHPSTCQVLGTSQLLSEQDKRVNIMSPSSLGHETSAHVPVDGKSLLNHESQKCEPGIPPTESSQKKRSPVKVFVTTDRETKDRVKIPDRAFNNELVVFDGRIPRVKLHKLDISRYQFGNLGDIKDWRGESTDSMEVSANPASDNAYEGKGLVTAVSEGSDQNRVSELAPKREHEKKKKRKKGRRGFARVKQTTIHKYMKLDHSLPEVCGSKSPMKSDTSLPDDRKRLSDCQNMLSERNVRRRLDGASSLESFDSGNPVRHGPISAFPAGTELEGDLISPGKDEGVVDSSPEVPQDGSWGLTPSSSDTEWEFPNGKSKEEDSDWDSSLEDEAEATPQKSVQPIKVTPFGDFRHMVLQDRLRLLGETLKEHNAVLNEIHRKPLSDT